MREIKIFRSILLLSVLILAGNIYAQTVYKGHWDGKIYVKLHDEIVNNKSNELVIDQFPLMGYLQDSFIITKSERPFIRSEYRPLQLTYRLSFNNPDRVDALIRHLEQHPDVDYAEKIPIDWSFIEPNDPEYNATNQWGLFKVLAEEAWDITTGSEEIVVAVVDNAIDINHPDLVDNIWTNENEIPNDNIDNDFNGIIDDIKGADLADGDGDPSPNFVNNGTTQEDLRIAGHGTHVSGTVAATTDNNIGIASIGRNIKIMALKTNFDNSPYPQIGGNPVAYDCIEYAIEQGADIINMSWGSVDSASQTNQNIIISAHNQGIVLVAAAGNDGVSDMAYPASYQHVISVAATGVTDIKTSFSQYNDSVDISAPGIDILSTVSYGAMYDEYQGTSMSAPLVAGACGLLLSVNAGMTTQEVETCLKLGADTIDHLQPTLFKNKLGAGRLNVKNSLDCAAELTSVGVDLNELVLQDTSYCIGNLLPVIEVANIGAKTIRELKIKYHFLPNGDENTFDWSGSISSDSTLHISLPIKNLTLDAVIKIEILEANGISDFLSNNRILEVDFCVEDDQFENELKVYPNITNRAVNVQFDLKDAAMAEVYVINETGNVVYYKGDALTYGGLYHVDMTGYSSGLYLVKVISEDKVASKKIILQK